MRRPKVLLTRRIPERGRKRLVEACEVVPWDGPEPMPRAELLARMPDADALMTAAANVVDRELIEAAMKMRIIANMAVGYDNIDLAAAAARGIVVTNTPNVLTETTADMAFGLLLASARRIAEASRVVREGVWNAATAATLLGEEVNGATIGIVGFGRIGRAMARRARGFSMRVLFTDPLHTEEMAKLERGGDATRTDLATLLRESDFVTLHPDLNVTSRGMIDAGALSTMKPTAILVNASRGPVVVTQALVEALERGTIRGAALDVTDPEPLPQGHPLRTLPNALVTPHMATQSRETRERMCDLAARNIVEVLAGRPPLTPVR